ncbi:FAD-binding and (Fe-S)-binding domain-containing protein [Oceaniglobus ichthyenteri]|uniref:FAD-binding and (Fe-S)-binding domain-containing protein n=1 Tax=Oceaniglobus ichthyenteri TaxID=2136177 RepID=UPI000D3849FD|nr:FAD-binding and (Fe-S)-binding domain-containing protein [Oceaniglobus ichthyenteri]
MSFIPRPPAHPLCDALRGAGFRGEVETDGALRTAMSTDNSVYQIIPDLIVAPHDAKDIVCLMGVLDRPEFRGLTLTPRGGGTGTNGQSLNAGVILDTRRHMNRLLQINAAEGWAEVEPGMVLDDLNDQLRPLGLFFAPETSTSTRCTIGGMVSTDASGKGSRIYGKTSDNILGLEIARADGLLNSTLPTPDWARAMLASAEMAARAGRAAFIAATPRINRRFTGYDLERACPETGGFEWWRLFLGAEGTLGPITRIRVALRPVEAEKRLIVAGFDSFAAAMAAATPLLADEPTAIEVMDERVQHLAETAGILARLPESLRPQDGGRVAYVFIEFNGDDLSVIGERVASCRARLAGLPGILSVHLAGDRAEIRDLWAIRSAGVGLLGKVDGPSRPVAFVEDCVVPPENLPGFVADFLALLEGEGLGFGIYGHVDVGCLHIRPALNLDRTADRDRLVRVSRDVFDLTRKHGGIFWGEHGKGVRGAFLEEWIGPEAYSALKAVKAAFDPGERFNTGKLVSGKNPVMGIATTPFRRFNSTEDDPLEKAFRCNGNAQCLSYAAATPICPSFKATADLRQSPKGRADVLRAWRSGAQTVNEDEVLAVLDTCLGCKACATSCPVQVDIPQMRSAFYADYYGRHRRPLSDRLTLLAERASPVQMRLAPALRPVWPLLRALATPLMGAVDLPDRIARPLPRGDRITVDELAGPHSENTVLIWQDWFTALYDESAQRGAIAGLRALGYRPRMVAMLPSGKAALNLGDMSGFRAIAKRLCAALEQAAISGAPMLGLDPAFVMCLRQDYPSAGFAPPKVLLPQEFLSAEIKAGRKFPQAATADKARLFNHCTEATALPETGALWHGVFAALNIELDTPATGCCGMAGQFGHQARHQTVSRRLFDLSWAAPVAAGGAMAATGYSCRCQAGRLSQEKLAHPLALIADLLGKSP